MTISPGENIGPYRVMEQLGSGGMATVFKAYHPSLDRYVAIKVLHPAFKANPQFFERFKREARIVAKLEHPHIIPVHDFNEHKGEPYLVMRFIEGDTLKPAMQGKPMPPEEVLRLMRPVCEALSYAHKQGVLHRDLKPSNIMVTTDGDVFLTDFGLARMVQAGESTLSQDMMVGTPQYISPEQAQGMSDLDGRTDIYSLGVILFEMLTGRVPFSADTPFATVHDHIYTPLPLPSTINPDIDPAVERMLLKALAKEPDDRFATSDELLVALENTLGAQIATASTITEPSLEISAPDSQTVVHKKKQGMPWWAWAGGAAIAVCVLAGILAGLLLLRQVRNRAIFNDQPAAAQEAGRPPGNPPPAGQPGQPPPGAPPPGDSVPKGPEHQKVTELARQAEAAMQKHQFDEAIDLYIQALETDPQYLPAYFDLSRAFKQSGDEEGSLVALEKAVENNPESPIPLLWLGETHMINDEPEAALENFEQAAHIAPDMPMPYAGQALALLRLDRDPEARQAIERALDLDQSSPEAHLAHAVYLHKQGNKQQALHELERLAKDTRATQFVREGAHRLLEAWKE